MSVASPVRLQPIGTAPSLSRLTLVELRKLADTRAGRWLLASTVLIAMGLVTIRIFAGPENTRTLDEFFAYALEGISLLAPVLAILAVTSEWSQRTALTTFALVPRRGRVLAAKLLAVLAGAVLGVLAALLLAVAGNVVAELLGRGGGWDVGVDAVLYALVFLGINMVMGAAFGALLLGSGVAIAVFFVVPIAWTILASTITALKHAAEWVDLATANQPLLTVEMSGDAWPKLAVATTLWVLLPLAAGAARLSQQEVK